MPSRPATMSDVARRAGVHQATVSRALRDDPRITPAQRATVKRAAAELGYRTNPLVAALMSVRRRGRAPTYQATLGYLTKYPPERAAWFRREFGQLFSGATARAAEQGYRLEEFNLADPALTPARITEILCSRGVHGLIVAPLHSVHDSIDIDWSRFCTVAVGYSLSHVAVHRIAHSHFAGYSLAVRHCRELGGQRPGLVLQRRVHEKVEKRWVAAALLDQSEYPGLSAVPPLLPDELREQEFAAWFREHRPDVILGVSLPDVPRWLRRLGLRVPRDVGLVSLDRRPADRELAGVAQDYAGLGGNGVDVLIGMLHRNERGLPAKPLTVLSDGLWIDGGSLRARPASARRG